MLHTPYVPDIAPLSFNYTQFYGCGTNFDALSWVQKCQLGHTKKYTPGVSPGGIKNIKKVSYVLFLVKILHPEISI